MHRPGWALDRKIYLYFIVFLIFRFNYITFFCALVFLTGAHSYFVSAEEPHPDYRRIFGKTWIKAEDNVEKNKDVRSIIFQEFEVPESIAVAVVFPEIMRYSAIKDFIETASVKAQYLQKGSKGANFSIGQFQMKPSFVELLEKEWMGSEFPHKYEIYFDLCSTVEARRARVRRIDDNEWQCIYLALFLKLMYNRFPELGELDVLMQVRVCASAYNGEYPNGEKLPDVSTECGYHTAFLPTSKTKKYCYSDIAACFFISRQSTTD